MEIGPNDVSTSRCCAHFRPLPNYYPISLKSLHNCLILTPSPHLNLPILGGSNLARVRIWHNNEFGRIWIKGQASPSNKQWLTWMSQLFSILNQSVGWMIQSTFSSFSLRDIPERICVLNELINWKIQWLYIIEGRLLLKYKAAFHDCMQRSVNKYTKQQIHQFIKNTYQLWKFVNIRWRGRIHSAKFMNGCMDKTIILPPCKLWSFLSVKAR